tara:strand:- start:1191 stop:1844 length:654 start_codon:yes stop_codon:yes gene_type:complete
MSIIEPLIREGINYLPLGSDCSPAAALLSLNLRNYALPFDWVSSNTNCLNKCFETNFKYFHKNLKFSREKTRMIDYYGFQFPHDYPFSETTYNKKDIGEGAFHEDKNKCIIDSWQDHHDIALEKYNRRIERFRNIVNDIKPIIVLCRYSTYEVLKLKELINKNFKIKNIYFVNSYNQVYENDNILNVFTEKNGIWNDANIWKEGIEKIIKKISLGSN